MRIKTALSLALLLAAATATTYLSRREEEFLADKIKSAVDRIVEGEDGGLDRRSAGSLTEEFVDDMFGRSEAEAEPCGAEPCGDNMECVDTMGNKECRCQKGFRQDGEVCEDIDECLELSAPCSENEWCTNTNGSFVCKCSWSKGFKKRRNGECKPLCKRSYYMFGMNCYKVFKKPATFNDAEQRCKKDGGILAEPEDLHQTKHLYSLLRGAATPAWLGVATGEFVWRSSKEPLAWTNWAPGQPDNNKSVAKSCIELHGPDVKCSDCHKEKWEAGQWNDRPCSDKRFFICQTAMLL